MDTPFIHALANVQANAIGSGTHIWQFVVVLLGSQIAGTSQLWQSLR